MHDLPSVREIHGFCNLSQQLKSNLEAEGDSALTHEVIEPNRLWTEAKNKRGTSFVRGDGLDLENPLVF